ncbi:MAG: outer membrane protein transport protein [bacterium]
MVKKMISTVLVFTIVVIIANPAWASNGTQIGIIGARSTGMGSCYRGLANDWSAVFFNPAGLTQLNGKWTIGISNGIVMPRGSYTAKEYYLTMFPFSGMNTEQVDATPQNFFVPSVGIFYNPSDKLTFGLGVFAPFGLGSEWDLIDLPSSYGNSTGISKDKESYSDHQVINVQPTVAFKVSDNISIGLGVSYIWGKMDLDMVKLAFNPALQSWGSLTQGLALSGITLPALTPDQYRIAVENNLSGSGTAWGANLGIHYKASDKLSFGASVRYSTDLKLSGDNTQITIMHGDATKYGILSAVPDAAFASDSDPTGTATKQGLLALFSGMNISETSDVEADLPLPLTAGAGFAYKATDKLTLVADVSMTRWSSWDVIDVEIEDGDNLELKQDWKNTIEVGVGAEYKLSSLLDLRAGIYTVDSPVPDETMSPTIPDPNRRYDISGGIGLHLGKITFNLTGEYVFFPNKTVDLYEFDFATGIAENYAGDYEFNAIVITAGAQINL